MTLPETDLTLIARMKDPGDERSCQEFVGTGEPFLLRMLIRRGLMDADATRRGSADFSGGLPVTEYNKEYMLLLLTSSMSRLATPA
jgi:hypothetical protein